MRRAGRGCVVALLVLVAACSVPSRPSEADWRTHARQALGPTDVDGARRFTVSGLVVGHGRPGSLLGYDRSPDQGPWLVATVVHRLHRHTGLVPTDRLQEVDWEAGVVRATGQVDPVSHAWQEA